MYLCQELFEMFTEKEKTDIFSPLSLNGVDEDLNDFDINDIFIALHGAWIHKQGMFINHPHYSIRTHGQCRQAF